MNYQYTAAHCQFFFKVKEIGKKGKHPERGDRDINGGGGSGDWGSSFQGDRHLFRWGSNVILVGHFEKGSADFSRKIINDHTIFLIINAKFRKKN